MIKHLLHYGGAYLLAIASYVGIFWFLPMQGEDIWWHGPLFMHVLFSVVIWGAVGITKAIQS